jgi:hypothetical protein
MTFYILVLNGLFYVENPQERISFYALDYEDAYDRIEFELEEMVDSGYIPVETSVQVVEMFLPFPL